MKTVKVCAPQSCPAALSAVMQAPVIASQVTSMVSSPRQPEKHSTVGKREKPHCCPWALCFRGQLKWYTRQLQPTATVLLDLRPLLSQQHWHVSDTPGSQVRSSASGNQPDREVNTFLNWLTRLSGESQCKFCGKLSTDRFSWSDSHIQGGVRLPCNHLLFPVS